MAVYEKKLSPTMKVVTRIFDFIEKYLNSRIHGPIIRFIFRNSKLGKVTRFIDLTRTSLVS